MLLPEILWLALIFVLLSWGPPCLPTFSWLDPRRTRRRSGCETRRRRSGCLHKPSQTRRRSGCEVGRDDLEVFNFAMHRSGPMRNFLAKIVDRSIRLWRFPGHATYARARPMRARTCTSPLRCRCHRHRHLQWQLQALAWLIDQLTLANSLPRHVRARPMRVRTCIYTKWGVFRQKSKYYLEIFRICIRSMHFLDETRWFSIK